MRMRRERERERMREERERERMREEREREMIENEKRDREGEESVVEIKEER